MREVALIFSSFLSVRAQALRCVHRLGLFEVLLSLGYQTFDVSPDGSRRTAHTVPLIPDGSRRTAHLFIL